MSAARIFAQKFFWRVDVRGASTWISLETKYYRRKFRAPPVPGFGLGAWGDRVAGPGRVQAADIRKNVCRHARVRML